MLIMILLASLSRSREILGGTLKCMAQPVLVFNNPIMGTASYRFLHSAQKEINR